MPVKTIVTDSHGNPMPRRCDVLQNQPSELAIRTAIQQVEEMEARPKLTEVVLILQDALTHLADYIDEINGIAVDDPATDAADRRKDERL